MTYSFDPSLANNSVFTLALGTVGVFAFYSAKAFTAALVYTSPAA